MIYSKGEFQALQLIALAVFGAWIKLLAYFLEIIFYWQFVCEFDIMEYTFFIVFDYLYAYVFAYILT